MSSSSSSRSTVRVDEWSLPSYPPSGTHTRPTHTVVGCGSLVDPNGGRCSNKVVFSVIVVVFMAIIVITGGRIARMGRCGTCAAVNHTRVVVVCFWPVLLLCRCCGTRTLRHIPQRLTLSPTRSP